ncbi:MAG: alanine:cation symporter family protein [Myxococcota bacterium]
MRELATQAWNPWIAWLLLGAGLVILLATVFVPLRGLPRAMSVLRGRSVTSDGRGAFWLPLAAATGMGGVTGGVLAVSTAGPGALVWMWIATGLGMALVFAEGSLSARRPDGQEAPTMHLLAAPGVGKLVAPMYALAFVVLALLLGAAFQTNQAAAVLESMGGITPLNTAIGLALAATPFVLVPKARGLLFLLVPVALVLYVVATLVALNEGSATIGLIVGDAINQAFGIAPMAGGAAGGGVGLLVAHGVLRATMAGEAGLGSAALLDLRSRSRGSAGAAVMLVPLLAAGLVGSLSSLLMLDPAAQGESVIEPELDMVVLERSYRRALRPNQRFGQTIALPEGSGMENDEHYEMLLRSNPRGHALARLVVPADNENLTEEEKAKPPHVVLPMWGIATNVDTVVFRARDSEKAKHPSWDVRVPCDREVKEIPGSPDQKYLLLRPKDPELDMRRMAVQLDLLSQPHVVFDDFRFIGLAGRANSPDPDLGEHLAMFEPPREDRPFNPKLHEFFRLGYRGPYVDSEGPRPPLGFVAAEGFEPEVGSVVSLRIPGNPRGDAVVDVTRSGSVEAPAWDFLLDARTLVIRHDTDPSKDIHLAVTPRYDLYRVRFDIADERYQDMRNIATKDGYSGPYLVVPDFEFEAEVRSDTRLDPKYAGRRVLVPLHPLTEMQGPFGEGDTYRPHPGELVDLGMAAPVLAHEGAQIVAARLERDAGSFGRSAMLLAVLVFALSTIVAWAELGGRAATALVGPIGSTVLRVAMLGAAAMGTHYGLGQLLPLIDVTLAAVVVPNVLGLLVLLPKIRAASQMKDDLADEAEAPDDAS